MVLKILNAAKKYWYFALICLIFSVGIACRLEVLFARELWFDEISLAANFTENSGFFWVFKPLQYHQIAPPLFLLCTKIMVSIFGINEFSLRLVPFLSGIASFFVFYKLSKTVLKTRVSILFANFLFATNAVMARFASEFKQYGIDVLVFMLLLMWLSGDFARNKEGVNEGAERFDIKAILKYSTVFTLLFFVSQPVVFLLFGFVLYNIILSLKQDGIKNYSKIFKIISISFIPLVFVLAYKFSMSKDLSLVMNNYWENVLPGFISFSKMKEILLQNYYFFTLGCKYMAVFAPFALFGFFIFLKRGSKISKIFALSLLGALFASILHLYPFVARIILFLLPFVFIFIAICFDFDIPNKRLKILVSSALILGITAATLLFQAKIFCKNRADILLGTSGNRELVLFLKENFDKERDVIILPETSIASFRYYSSLLNFKAGYEDRNFEVKKLAGRGGKDFAWVYLSFNMEEDLRLLDKEILALIKGNKICYEITLSKWARLFKLKLED